MSDTTVTQALSHWFTQGGEAQFGSLGDPRNADELTAAILRAVRSRYLGRFANEVECEASTDRMVKKHSRSLKRLARRSS